MLNNKVIVRGQKEDPEVPELNHGDIVEITFKGDTSFLLVVEDENEAYRLRFINIEHGRYAKDDILDNEFCRFLRLYRECTLEILP